MSKNKTIERARRTLGIFLALSISICIFLTPKISAKATYRSADIVSVALSQLDYEEKINNDTKYGRWYGMNYAYWCDMFVSWCAASAGLPKSMFPRSASTTNHVKLFSNMGIYHGSVARGGSYVPKQGDAIFFYDHVTNPKGNILQHAGIVIGVENGYVFTVEGNTKTIRRDYSYYEEILPIREDTFEREGTDYVAVKYYPLNDKQIHGYASIRYTDTTPLVYDGFIDLGRYEPQRKAFTTLAAENIMPGTSSFTFSPRYGMTRGEFLNAILTLYNLSDYDETTVEFADVPPSHQYYNAVMTARHLGLVEGSGDNMFKPDVYISGAAVNAIIKRTLTYFQAPTKSYTFTDGDLSYLFSPYAIRADIASALYDLYQDMKTPVLSKAPVTLNGESVELPLLSVGGANYLTQQSLADALGIATETSETTSNDGQQISKATTETDGAAGADSPSPEDVELKRTLLRESAFEVDGTEYRAKSFIHDGKTYLNLRSLASAYGLDVEWDSETKTIVLNNANES